MQYILTFPHMGEVYIIARSFFETLGCRVVVSPYNNKKILEKGVLHSPPEACIPFKITLGAMIEALEMGANTIFMLGDTTGKNVGICRLPQYPRTQGEILRELGYQFKIFGLLSDWLNILYLARKIVRALCGDPPDYYRRLKEAARVCWQKVTLVDLINELKRKYRPLEVTKGETTKITEAMFKLVDDSKTLQELREAQTKIIENFKNIEIDQKRRVIKIGMGGEFFVNLDHFTNCDLERRLGELGVWLENPTSYMYLMKAPVALGPRRRFVKLGYKQVPISSGGEDIPTVGRVEYFAKKGFHGYLVAQPFGCMPETAVIPFIEHLGEKFKISTFHLSIDENLSETYLQTRLEAWVNTLKRRYA